MSTIRGIRAKGGPWALVAASAALLALSAPAAHADVVTTAMHYWGNSVQGSDPYSVGYDSREAAAIGAASYWCALPANVSYFSNCSYGGMDADGNVTVVTNQGSFKNLRVYEFWSCNVGGQIMGQFFGDTWKDANGISHTPACVLWGASTPPPPPKVIAIDPGHGFECAAKGRLVGAIGVTDFPANDPPAGRLREDELTMAIAREVERILPKSKYRVVLTKTNVNECPSFEQRGRIANEERAKAFVSIHINKAYLVFMTNWPVPFAHGTSVLYRAEKPESLSLAESMARHVSSSLGVNNRGTKVDNLWVLSPNVTETKVAVLVESARLSGEDEKKLHAADSAMRIAAGIKAALDESLGN